jgi:Transglutaminase-like superfamily/Coenzyme PQQ synthesis protein D (PqqD)
MSMSAILASNHFRPVTERIRKYKDGTVLLSIAQDRICKLNGVGAMTWTILEDTPVGLSLDGIVAALEQQFDTANSEGELRYDVSREQLRSDTARFLERLEAMGFLHVLKDLSGSEIYSIKDDVSGTTSSAPSPAIESQDLDIHFQTLDEAREEPQDDIKFSKRETFQAFLGLLAFDLLLKFAGFQALINKVQNWPTTEPRTTDREICRRVRGTVDRAQMYYPKKAMCLQHSAVITCLLRRHGVPAEMVLAAQELPPKAHAWTEVMNEVVSDSPGVKIRYRELRRL